MISIAPSLLAADFARLGEVLKLIREAGVSAVHVDVRDGHFAPEISVGQPVVRSLRKATDLVLDVHLLVERPERYVPEFLEMGVDRIAIHAEATPNLHRALEMIRSGGAEAGLALNPCTAVECARDALEQIDYLLIVSSDLGTANSPFLPNTLRKLQTACALRRERQMDFALQVEGSITEEQVEALGQAGADILVTGSDIFQGDAKARLARMMRLAASAGQVTRV